MKLGGLPQTGRYGFCANNLVEETTVEFQRTEIPRNLTVENKQQHRLADVSYRAAV